MRKRILLLTLLTLIVFTFYRNPPIYSAWEPDRPDLWTDTGSTGAQKSQKNFEWLDNFISKLWGYWDGTTWTTGADTEDPTAMQIMGPLRNNTVANEPTGIYMGEVFIQTSASYVTLTIYNSTLGSWVNPCAGVTAAAGVDGIRGSRSYSFGEGYIELLGGDGIINTQATLGSGVTQITSTAKIGNYWYEQIQAVDGGNLNAPFTVWYGASRDDTLGTYIHEFSNTVSTTQLWTWYVPPNCDVTENIIVYADYIFADINYATETAAIALTTTYYNATSGLLAETGSYKSVLLPSQMTNYSSGSAITVTYQTPLTITANTLSKGDLVTLHFVKNVTSALDTIQGTFGIRHYYLRYVLGL